MRGHSFASWLVVEENHWASDPDDVIRGGFIFLRDARGSLGGAADKHMLLSRANGLRYMFKPGAKNAEDRPQQPHADVLGARMSAELLGPAEYVPVGLIPAGQLDRYIAATPGKESEFARFLQRYNGVGGSVQPLIPGAQSRDYRYDAFGDLSPQDIAKLQKEQVIDWLISNHDSHGNQFIRVNGKLLGIDKSQALKYFGADALHPGYSPNRDYGEDDPVYNHIFRAVQAGKMTVDPMIIKPLLDTVERMSDEQYLRMFEPFLGAMQRHPKPQQGMKGLGGIQPQDEKVSQMILARKRNVKRDFAAYYSKMLRHPVVF